MISENALSMSCLFFCNALVLFSFCKLTHGVKGWIRRARADGR